MIVEDLGAEGGDEALGEVRADPLQQPRRQVLLEPLGRRRRRRPHPGGLELHAVRAVAHPDPAGLDRLAGGDGGHPADDGGEVDHAGGTDAQHGEPALLVVVGDPLDDAGEEFAVRGGSTTPLYSGTSRGTRAASPSTPNVQLPTTKALPIPNLQPGRARGRRGGLGVGRWESLTRWACVGRASKRRRARPYSAARNTSSRLVSPITALATPSMNIVRMPAVMAACRRIELSF